MHITREWKNLFCLGCILSMTLCAGAKSRPTKQPRAQPVPVIAREMLAIHNAIRDELKLPRLQWSSRLAAFSQKWADTLLARNRAAHNPNSPYGENIFVTGTGSTPGMVVKEWASEARDYSYRTNECLSDCGHYTQLVWRRTQRVGCAIARGAGREVWVCSYDPPGNYSDEWPY